MYASSDWDQRSPLEESEAGLIINRAAFMMTEINERAQISMALGEYIISLPDGVSL